MPLTEQTTTSLPRLPASQESTIMIDAMATIQMAKFERVSTFGQLASKYYNIFTAPLQHWNCSEVHIVSDRYSERSIKSG